MPYTQPAEATGARQAGRASQLPPGGAAPEQGAPGASNTSNVSGPLLLASQRVSLKDFLFVLFL